MFRVLFVALMLGVVAGDQRLDELLRDLLSVLRSEGERAVGYQDQGKIMEMYEDVRRGNIMWCTAEYEGKTIVPGYSGDDYAGMLQRFHADNRVYAYVRLMVNDRAKFAFIAWIGPSVSPLKKAKVSTDKAFVKQIFTVFDNEILADELNEVNDNKVRTLLGAA